MNTKVFKFIAWLLALMLVFYGFFHLMRENIGNVSLFIWRTCNILYLFTPALAVLFVEKWKVKEIFSSYRLTVKGMDVKKGIQYILATAFAVPLLMFILTYILGNLLGAKCFGEISITSVPPFSEIALSMNSYVRMGIFYFISVGIILLSGLIVQFFVLGGEIAWRGFLEKQLTCAPVPKTLLIGLIWGIWNIPLITKGNFTGFLLTFGEILLFCVVCSFYLRRALQQTRTLFAPAAIMGVITALPFIFLLLVKYDEANTLLAGDRGLIAVISIACVHIVFTWINPKKVDNKRINH
jgi:hypothetical protein